MQTNRRTWNTFEEMRAAADQNDPAAQCYLAICYQTGQGVQQDYAEAVKWFRRAAEQNDSAAQCYLGFCYQTGSGVPKSSVKLPNGFERPPNRAIPLPNSIWESFTKPARASRRTTPKRSNGITLRPSKANRRHSS